MIATNIDILRTKSLDFNGTPDELKSLVKVLEFELSHAVLKCGAGLSAIQINIPYRVSIIRTEATNLDLYNTKITRAEQPCVFKGEGCLSFPNLFLDTNRYNLITVVNGDGKEYKFSGFEAIVVQHELDHWEGRVLIDNKAEVKK